jgi:hypothetical protein
MLPPLELTTRDGYDLTFGTNVIGKPPVSCDLIYFFNCNLQAISI